MKVLLISDSHGLENELRQVAEAYTGKVDLMIHCGDSELPAVHEVLENFLVVKGNCDLENFPEDLLEEAGEFKLYATHGHLYNVKMSLANISYRADEVGANIVCFGHSHLAGSELIDGILMINPGSFRLPRGRKERTYCILELINRNVSVIFYDHEHEKIEQLCYTYTL
ncbi:metallophosphoesterase family protein [Bacillus salitolerans]|uniref:Phosphoesterase n=1 Tax=Bacillus salitolerans TaxID=1437434 RepID=A0ABW4LNA0_9BACI